MIYHVYSSYQPKDSGTARRMRLAARTWVNLPWTNLPVGDEQVRLYRDIKGVVPFVQDILKVGIRDKKDEDIIVFTNADICVSTDCCFKITMALQSVDAVYCFRRDFRNLNVIVPDAAIKQGHHYCGSDLYAFRVGWWRTYKKEFPDMLLGREAWDAVLRILIEQTHPDQNVTLHNLIYHEKHASVWENPNNRRTIPSQIHNINLAKEFCYTFGFDPRRIGL